MECCRNVILHLVYEEANRQLQKAGAKSNLSLGDVVAYSLNRIPPLFLSRQSEWQPQITLLKTTITEQIEEVVRKAILQARKPRLESVNPVPPKELSSPMLSLLELRTLLKQPEMTWLTLPQALENYLSNINRASGTRVVKFPIPKEMDEAASKAEYDQYLIPAQIKMVNAIEHLISRLVVSRLDSLPPKLTRYARLIRVDEVMALVLNSLPPMYATTEEGLKRFRYHSRMQIGSQLAEIVTKAVIALGQEASKNFVVPTLIFQNIRQERQAGIAKLNWMLKRQDITWENSYSLILESIDRLRLTGELDWQRITPVAENA